MTAIRHHPPEELLIDYAGGGASEGEATLIAAHLAACPECRGAIGMCEEIGGALLQGLDPAPLPADLLDRTLSGLQHLPPDDPPPSRPATGLPGFLADRVGPDLAKVPWRGIGERGVYEIPGCPESEQLWLVRAGAGQAGLKHLHVGDEWTVVLEGGFRDDEGTYTTGDFMIVPAGTRHQPIADMTGSCVCLFLLRAPLRFTNPVVRALARLFS